METEYDKLQPKLLVLGAIETVGLLVGGVVNLLLLIFHLKKSNKSTTILLYCLMNATDLLICTLMIPTVISCLAGSKPLFFETVVARDSWLFIWEVSGRTSVFLIGLQSVLRTRALLFPFSRRIKKSWLAGIFLMYTLILSALQSVRFFHGVHSVFSPRTNRPTLQMIWLQSVMGIDKVGTIFFGFFCNLFGYVIPFLPITISCAISIYCIRKSKNKVASQRKEAGADQAGQPDQHGTATRTVIVLTAVYLVTNFPIFVVELNEILMHISILTKKQYVFINWEKFQKDHPLEYVYIYVTVYNIFVLLNSTINGLVLLYSNNSIRQLMKTGFVRKFSRKISSMNTEMQKITSFKNSSKASKVTKL